MTKTDKNIPLSCFKKKKILPIQLQSEQENELFFAIN